MVCMFHLLSSKVQYYLVDSVDLSDILGAVAIDLKAEEAYYFAWVNWTFKE